MSLLAVSIHISMSCYLDTELNEICLDSVLNDVCVALENKAQGVFVEPLIATF